VLRLFTPAAFALVLVLAELSAPARAAAQSVTGSIFGSVVDQTKQAVPGAAITLLNERTADTRAIVSDERGDFLFASVQPGLYTVKVELAGSMARAAAPRPSRSMAWAATISAGQTS
jgi:hypothetical protein